MSVSKDDTDAEVTQVLTTPTDGYPPFPEFDPVRSSTRQIDNTDSRKGEDILLKILKGLDGILL